MTELHLRRRQIYTISSRIITRTYTAVSLRPGEGEGGQRWPDISHRATHLAPAANESPLSPLLSCQNGQTWLPLLPPTRAPRTTRGVDRSPVLRHRRAEPSRIRHLDEPRRTSRHAFCAFLAQKSATGFGLNPRTQPQTTIGTFRRRCRNGATAGATAPPSRKYTPHAGNKTTIE